MNNHLDVQQRETFDIEDIDRDENWIGVSFFFLFERVEHEYTHARQRIVVVRYELEIVRITCPEGAVDDDEVVPCCRCRSA